VFGARSFYPSAVSFAGFFAERGAPLVLAELSWPRCYGLPSPFATRAPLLPLLCFPRGDGPCTPLVCTMRPADGARKLSNAGAPTFSPSQIQFKHRTCPAPPYFCARCIWTYNRFCFSRRLTRQVGVAPPFCNYILFRDPPI